MSLEPPRVLVSSDYNARLQAFNTPIYEFCRVIGQCEVADLLAPGCRLTKAQREAVRIYNKFRRDLGFTHVPTMDRANVEKDYDLFFYVCNFPDSLIELSRLRDWRQRSKKAAAFLLETWSKRLKQNKAYLRMLDEFDHVFLFNPASVPNVQKYTKTPCSFLPMGIDCLMASPGVDPPERCIDVYSLGRRSDEMHKALIAWAEANGAFYVYDSLSGAESRVVDWYEHRLMIINNLKRSQFFVAFSSTTIDGPKALEAGNEHALSFRIFEAAATGAIMIGSAPQCPEFGVLFDWPDAVFDVRDKLGQIGEVIDDLRQQPERLAKLRQTGISQSLLRHDWAYRWEDILKTMGMQPHRKLMERRARLHELARLASPAAAALAASNVVTLTKR